MIRYLRGHLGNLAWLDKWLCQRAEHRSGPGLYICTGRGTVMTGPVASDKRYYVRHAGTSSKLSMRLKGSHELVISEQVVKNIAK